MKMLFCAKVSYYVWGSDSTGSESNEMFSDTANRCAHSDVLTQARFKGVR